MSGIKWENIVIGTTMIGNQIVIGKLTKDKMAYADKSGNMTNQTVNAVYRHMKAEFERNKEDDPTIINLEFAFPDGSKLVYMPNKEEMEE
jgi:hypothetical protein